MALPHFSRALRGAQESVDVEADFRWALDVLIRGLTSGTNHSVLIE